MTSYRVGVIFSATCWVMVEASNPEEAKEKAVSLASPCLCYACVGELDVEDPTGEAVVEETSS